VRKPDFFMVGAQKCGTTALYQYLRQHPDVFMPQQKEIHFFAPDLDSGSELDAVFFTRDLEQYLSLFEQAQNQKRIGEASPGYLYSHVAAAKIKEFCPHAGIIIMLRNPVEMMYALHAQRLFSGNEDIADFEAALEAEVDRKRGLRLPKYAYNIQGLFYRETARFTEQVRRFVDSFGLPNIHVIIFDDLKKDTPGVYRRTCEYLEIDPDFQPQFEIINPNTTPRNKALRDFVIFQTMPLQRLMKNMPAPVERKAKQVGKLLLSVNTKQEPRPPLTPELRQRLQAEFAPEVDQLGELLGLDLKSMWT